ncbi:uncharacterized protein MELLADRAFT_90363 [Melampsora larici-populina 98AG31]|uniref:Uncharacterized protein n=1 Tax=Melampsora larici-populina (strain 98AG31 / pathotype 3-4-7) TaxID=747676 RepID=F4RWN2_MELLP|nr:uncharacterized protein MELLADRAFT_90363 [Melampsora larici-populina 98AG31]EGG03202.1 hypothetical protein MELLADRAFT_90363 [Melampsora larici-populina 98AG31]
MLKQMCSLLIPCSDALLTSEGAQLIQLPAHLSNPAQSQVIQPQNPPYAYPPPGILYPQFSQGAHNPHETPNPHGPQHAYPVNPSHPLFPHYQHQQPTNNIPHQQPPNSYQQPNHPYQHTTSHYQQPHHPYQQHHNPYQQPFQQPFNPYQQPPGNNFIHSQPSQNHFLPPQPPSQLTAPPPGPFQHPHQYSMNGGPFTTPMNHSTNHGINGPPDTPTSSTPASMPPPSMSTNTSMAINSSLPGPLTLTQATAPAIEEPNVEPDGQNIAEAVELIQNERDTDWPPIGNFVFHARLDT